MRYYVPIPDNEDAFYAFVHLVINNRNNKNSLEGKYVPRPAKIGWVVPLTYTHNEVGEPFVVCQNNKEKCFIEMLIEQFTLLRTHWNTIQNLVRFPNASRYLNRFPPLL